MAFLSIDLAVKVTLNHKLYTCSNAEHLAAQTVAAVFSNVSRSKVVLTLMSDTNIL